MPRTGPDQDWKHAKGVVVTACKKGADFLVANELRGQKIRRDQENGDVGLPNCLFDLGTPIVARCNSTIMPDIENALHAEDIKLRLQLLFP